MKIAVAGARGRLGSLICEVVEELPEFELVARLNSDSDPTATADADVVIDVTRLDASQVIVSEALARGQKVIIGTSGYAAAELDALREQVSAAEGAALVVPNFSLGSVIGTLLARIVAPHFESIEIVEAHHDRKIDSPSGTAVRTAESIAEARAGVPVQAPHTDQPARGELVAGVPVHSLRLQGVVAKQEVRFGGAGEVLTITHDTHSNDAYRAGIVAALRAIGDMSGLVVGLEHVLGISGAQSDSTNK